jgi:hypothetical protein
MLMFRVYILPVLLYCCETWAVKDRHVQRLHVFYMQCLRRILGVTRLDMYSNDDILSMCDNQPPLENIIRLQRLRWFGHLMRMSDDRLPRKIFHCKVLGGHGPKKLKSWAQRVQDDLHLLKVAYHWQRIVLDHAAWRRLIIDGCTSLVGKRM